MRSVAATSDTTYDNVFTALTDTHSPQEEINAFMEALGKYETGSIIFDGDGGRFVYTYTPVESVEGWYLLSIVPEEVIRDESDRMLEDTQTMFAFLVVILVFCVVFALLIWRTQKDIAAKDKEVQYQARLFEVFASYLASNQDDVYFMLDHKTEDLEYISPNVERVLGVSGEKMFDYLRSSDMETDAEATQVYYKKIKAMSPGESAAPRNTEWVDPRTGERKYFVERAHCTDIQGRIKRVCCISDRTREQKAQDSLSEALRMAQAANDAKTAFLGNVSHDIRTPMNAIIGFLSLMRDEAENPDTVREYTQRIDAASQHLLGLINDVLDMNKIESGGVTLTISELNLAEVIEEINTIIRPQARAKNQTSDIFATHLNYEHLLGDKLRINQILINLLSNAVKYTQRDGALQLRVEELPQVVKSYSRVRFTVSDNGLETTRLIRERYSDKIPILLLTAYDWSEIEQEAMEIGVNHFMPKPFFMSTFKDAICRILDRQKRRKALSPT